MTSPAIPTCWAQSLACGAVNPVGMGPASLYLHVATAVAIRSGSQNPSSVLSTTLFFTSLPQNTGLFYTDMKKTRDVIPLE